VTPSAPRIRPEARIALGAGLVIVIAYAVLGAWSGSVSPLARGPLLDGLGPTNYRWVSPPPELASTNQPPSSGRFDLPLDEQGTGSQVAFTSDSQVTVVIDEGSVGPAQGQRSVQLLIEPLDPADLPAPGDGLAVFGNAYELSATYRPSGDRVRGLDLPVQVILTYPATSTLHANRHDMLYSPDGAAWQTLPATDSPGLQQIEAAVPGLGFVMVAGVPAPTTPSPAATGSAGTPPIAVALLVAAGVVLVIGLGLLIRSRNG
jgi:hypothetical protein